MRVTLSPDEVLQASVTGVMRYTQNMRLGRSDAYGADRSREHGMWISILGAMGEAATAKALNRWHFGLGVFRGADVAGVQVRTTRMSPASLILHKRDKEENASVPYISVIYCGKDNGVENFELQGWGTPEELVSDEFWSDPTGQNRPAFFIPASKLKDISSLRVSQ